MTSPPAAMEQKEALEDCALPGAAIRSGIAREAQEPVRETGTHEPGQRASGSPRPRDEPRASTDRPDMPPGGPVALLLSSSSCDRTCCFAASPKVI
jgi:hypothetical protein